MSKHMSWVVPGEREPDPPPNPPPPNPPPQKCEQTLKDTKLNRVAKAIGYTFKNPEILWEALQVEGFGATIESTPDRPITYKGNQLLSTLGHGYATWLVTEEWYYYRDLSEGSSPIPWHNKYLSTEKLAHVCRQRGLELSIQTRTDTGGNYSERVRATTMAAIPGAVVEDAGSGRSEAVKGVMRKMGLLPAPRPGAMRAQH